jgi:hypothetical protein
MSWLLYPQYPLDRRLGGPQSWSGHGGEEKNFPAPAGNQTPKPHSSSPQPVIIPTELHQLLHKNYMKIKKIRKNIYISINNTFIQYLILTPSIATLYFNSCQIIKILQ